ncbi:hypothetical protein [Microbulbifer sp. S227A]|uniref:hypothetical protein n=1 Tax=Microbulbifer sp. S227A TaxID=3415131 RepID=UPI003C7A6AD3
MQFIDQASGYAVKSMSLDKAIAAGRATIRVEPDGARVAACFRPALDAATAFDRDINDRVKFNTLSTPDKLDLMIEELLPRFFHAENLAKTGRDQWHVAFLVDGRVRRALLIDADGVRAVDEPQIPPAVEIETDIMTLMAILRSVIADYHTRKLDPEAL